MTTEPAFVAETLAWCNEKRAEYGKAPLDRLPKGHRIDRRSCPCGTATGLEVYAAVAKHPDGHSELTPLGVEKFVLAFDAGQLSQYDADADEAVS